MAWALGLACLRPLMDELRDLVPVALSIAGMTGLLVLTFMLWLHMGISHRLAILAALALCAAAAIVLAAYARLGGRPVRVAAQSETGSDPWPSSRWKRFAM